MGAVENPLLLRRHRISVADYHRMAEVGLLAPDARVELIEGEVIDMAPIGTRHGSAVKRLLSLLVHAAGERGIVAVQDALRLNEHSEPQPDVMLLKPRADVYAHAHPGPADVLLLIEVSDTTARYDREIKLPLYARHGVPEVWIVDLDARVVRLHRKPHGDEYAETQVVAAPGVTPIALLPGAAIDLSNVLV